MNALFHSRFVETFGWMLLHSLWQLVLIAGIWAAGLALLRRASANARYLLASLGLALMLAAPIFTYARLLPPAPRAYMPTDIPVETVVTVGFGTGRLLPTVAPVTSAPAASWPLAMRLRSALTPWLPWAVGGYFLGMAAVVLRLLAGYACIRGFVSRGTILQGRVAALALDLARRMKVQRPIRILQSAAIEVPTLLGVLKPIILLPASALTGLSSDQLAALLAHEIAHIRRHDYLANLIQSLIETLLFYHPAAWWLSARIRHERELCCDDAAIAATTDRLVYARALAAMESLRAPTNLVLAARGGSLLGRIRHVLQATPARAPRRFLTTSAVALVMCLLAALAYIGCNQSTSPGSSSTPSAHATSAGDSNTHTFDIRYLIPATSDPAQRQKAIADLIAGVQSAVAPTSWKPAGTGELSESDGRLTITQTSENLSAVNKYLEQLFETRALGVNLECRALLVSSNFLDDFRVGWSLGVMFEGDPLRAPPNNASIIDNWTLNLLLSAAQADRRSISLTAHALTPNGYPISVDILPPVGETSRVSGKDFTGLHLNVKPAASADRRYVILEGLRPARISTVPPAPAPATGRPAATTMCSTPDGGTLLINGGPLADADGQPTYHLLILVRPNLLAGGPHVLEAAGIQVPRVSPDPPAALPTTPAPGQILVKAVIVELEADALAKLAPGAATQPATAYGITPSTQPTGRVGLVENPEDLLKKLEKLAAAKQADIIARPSLLMQDGQEAYLNMGQQVPFVRGYYTDPEKGRRPAVDYRLVGIRLDVLPRLMEDKLIQLDVDTSLSALANVQPPPDPATGMPPIGTPVIDERTAKVRLAVKDGETVLLSLQPSKPGKETLVFITPHAAPNPADLPLKMPLTPVSPAPDPRP
jgi:hypothetical protein